MIRTKRAYERPSPADGTRILVDRLVEPPPAGAGGSPEQCDLPGLRTRARVAEPRASKRFPPPAGAGGCQGAGWPRGLKKEEARIDLWMKDLAPSAALRTWFGHDPARWDEFRKRFFAELDERRDLVEDVAARRGTITLVYASREERHNNAIALREYLTARRKPSARKKAA